MIMCVCMKERKNERRVRVREKEIWLLLECVGAIVFIFKMPLENGHSTTMKSLNKFYR